MKVLIIICLVIFISTAYAFEITDTILINNGSSSTLTKIPNSNHQFNSSNMTWLSGITSANFTNNSVYSINKTGEITISFWINISNFTFQGQAGNAMYTNFLGKTTYDPTNNLEWQFRIENATGLDGTDPRPCRFSFYVFNQSGGLGVGSYFQDNETTNTCPSMHQKWINIIGIVNSTNTFIYKDGWLRDSDVLSSLGITPNITLAPLHLGNDLDGGKFIGGIKSLVIYNRSLSNEEVATLNNMGINGNIQSAPIYNDTYLNFTGQNGFVDTQFLETNFSSEVSFTGWFFRNNNDSAHTIFGGSNSQSPLLRLETNNAIRFWANQSGASSTWTNNSTNGGWINFALIFNDSNGNTSLYVNGVWQTNFTTTNHLAKLGQIWLGKRQGTANLFNGSIDDFAIYNKSLNSSEVLSIYNAGRNNNNSITSQRLIYLTFNTDNFTNFYDNQTGSYIGYLNNEQTTINSVGVTHASDNVIVGYRNISISDNNLVGRWLFNENQGSTLYDVSSQATNGTFSGATWQNDGNNITLTENTDYTLSSNIFTLLNPIYSWSQVLGYYDDDPILTALSPLSGNDEDGVVEFDYNVSDYSTINNCTLTITRGEDGASDSFIDNTITQSSTQYFLLSNANTNKLLSNQLRWYIKCIDSASNQVTTPTYLIDTQVGSGTPGTEQEEIVNTTNITLEVNNTLIVYQNQTNCDLSVSSPFDVSISLFKFSFGNLSCKNISFFKYLVEFDEVGLIIGIRFFPLLGVIIIVFSLILFKKNGKLNKDIKNLGRKN